MQVTAHESMCIPHVRFFQWTMIGISITPELQILLVFLKRQLSGKEIYRLSQFLSLILIFVGSLLYFIVIFKTLVQVSLVSYFYSNWKIIFC